MGGFFSCPKNIKPWIFKQDQYNFFAFFYIPSSIFKKKFKILLTSWYGGKTPQKPCFNKFKQEFNSHLWSNKQLFYAVSQNRWIDFCMEVNRGWIPLPLNLINYKKKEVIMIKQQENQFINLCQDLMFKIFFSRNEKLLLSLAQTFIFHRRVGGDKGCGCVRWLYLKCQALNQINFPTKRQDDWKLGN